MKMDNMFFNRRMLEKLDISHCKNESNNKENLANSQKYQTKANSESIPADKNNSAICENFNNSINNNINNNFSSQNDPNLFSYNYLNGTSHEINGTVYSPNSIYNSENNKRNFIQFIIVKIIKEILFL